MTKDESPIVFLRVSELAFELKMAREEEREACAKVAERLWQQFQDTKDAHERNTMEPFRPSRFGFDLTTVQQSQRIADTIRARGKSDKQD